MSNLIRHASRYSIGSVLGIAASLISFPVLTRLLSVEEYGAMNTVAMTLTLLVALGKLGLQRATVRFYHEAVADSPDRSARTLSSTLILGAGGISLAATAMWAAFVWLAPADWIGTPRIVDLMLLSTPLILLRVLDSAFTNLLYAREQSGRLSAYGVFKRYLVLACVIVALLVIVRDAAAVLAATIVAEAVCLAIAGVLVLRELPLEPNRFSRALFGRMVAFGLPMVGVEMAWSLLAVGDRYVIQQLMGSAAVGVYSAAYNLCEYVKTATVVALATAVTPIYTRIWETEGRAATEAFLGTYARSYMAAALFVAALVSVNAAPLLTVAASEKYAAATVIVPWVMIGMALESYVGIAAAGLMLKKRSVSIFAMVALASVLNIALNYLLIPLIGLTGAAVATLVAFAILMAASIVVGRSELRIGFPFVTVAAGAGAFAAAVWLGDRVSTDRPMLDMLLRSGVVLIVYWPAVLLADRRLRADLRRFVPSLRQRLGLAA